jgi:hypothetical protein
MLMFDRRRRQILSIIFYQDRSIKWTNHRNELDGVTTNGILLMHIDIEQYPSKTKSTTWKEVSVGGSVFDVRDGRVKLNYEKAVCKY